MPEAFLALIKQNHDRLWRMCRFYGRDASLQEDVYQEICCQAWRSYQAFRGDAQASTWIYRVAVNTALSYVRKVSKRKTERLQHNHMNISEQAKADENLEKNEQFTALYKAIATLKKLDQTLILLYLEELEYKEISEVTGLTISNVGVRLNRIKKKLATKIPA